MERRLFSAPQPPCAARTHAPAVPAVRAAAGGAEPAPGPAFRKGNSLPGAVSCSCPVDQMRTFLFILAAGLAIVRPGYADPDGTAKRTVAALRKFGILNVALSPDCSLGLERGGQRWMYRASPGEQPALIARTANGETSRPILRARLAGAKKLRIVLAARYAEKPWEIVLHRLSDGTYRTFRSAPLGNKHVLSVENGIYVESHRPTPPLQHCRE
jgi:hypothetical protein